MSKMTDSENERELLLPHSQPLIHDGWSSQPQRRRRRSRFGPILCGVLCTLILLPVLVIVAGMLFLLLGLPPARLSSPQQPDLTHEPFAVGFDLTAGYGTAAIAFRNGTTLDVKKVEGDEKYIQVMKQLSLESSKHLSPPYCDFSQRWNDYPRQLKRQLRRWRGKPASEQVAALINVLESLKAATEPVVKPFGDLKYAFVTIPRIPALYTEDLVDACDHLGLQMLTLPWSVYGPHGAFIPVSEFNTAYAGSGLGVCSDFMNDTHCGQQLNCGYDDNSMNVLFTREAFTAHVGPLCYAMHLYAASGSVEFELGLNKASSVDGYWNELRQAVRDALASYYRGRRLTNVVSYGESANDSTFTKILREEVKRVQEDGFNPRFVTKHPIFAGARGAAEFGKQCMMKGWNGCFPDLTPHGILFKDC